MVEEPERQYWLVAEREGEIEEKEVKWSPRED